jgi:hypothetical protein
LWDFKRVSSGMKWTAFPVQLQHVLHVAFLPPSRQLRKVGY